MSTVINPHHKIYWWQQVNRKISIAKQEPANLIGIVLLGLFAYLIAAPVISILTNSALVQAGDSTRVHAAEGTFTSYYVTRAMTSRMSELLLWQY